MPTTFMNLLGALELHHLVGSTGCEQRKRQAEPKEETRPRVLTLWIPRACSETNPLAQYSNANQPSLVFSPAFHSIPQGYDQIRVASCGPSQPKNGQHAQFTFSFHGTHVSKILGFWKRNGRVYVRVFVIVIVANWCNEGGSNATPGMPR